MTDLEWIERKIETIKEALELEDVLYLATDKEYKGMKDRLQHLQQIKAKLEKLELLEETIAKDCIVGKDIGLSIVDRLCNRITSLREELKKAKPNKTIKQIVKMIASGEIPKKVYDKYLSDCPIGFMNEEELLKALEVADE